MRTRLLVLACILALTAQVVAPAVAAAASTSWGVMTAVSPRFDEPPDGMTRVSIRSGGTTYAFRTHNTYTVYYLKRLNSSRFVKVSRNSWVRAMQHADVNPDPGARVSKWSWRGASSNRYRYARVIYGDQNYGL